MKVLLVGGPQDGRWIELPDGAKDFVEHVFDWGVIGHSYYHFALQVGEVAVFKMGDFDLMERLIAAYRPSEGLNKKLEHAELVISKIGLGSPEPEIARRLYERSYGRIEERQKEKEQQ